MSGTATHPTGDNRLATTGWQAGAGQPGAFASNALGRYNRAAVSSAPLEEMSPCRACSISSQRTRSLIALSAYAIYARRMLVRARAPQRWSAIRSLRDRERAPKAERALDIAALALVGDRSARQSLQRLGQPKLSQAVRYVESRIAEASATRPEPTRARKRAGNVRRLEPPDQTVLRRRLLARETELRAVQAEIQALADPDHAPARLRARETRRVAKEAERAALEAGREARERRRRGLRATTATPELGLELAVGPEGIRSVRHKRPRPTPEDIAGDRD